MTSDELVDWLAYSQLEPFGEERADLRSGIVACTVANCMSTKRHRLEEFIPKFGAKEDRQSQDWRQVKAYFMMRSAEDRKRGNKHNRKG